MADKNLTDKDNASGTLIGGYLTRLTRLSY